MEISVGSVEKLSAAVQAGNISEVQKYIDFLPQANGCALARDAIKNNNLRVLELLLVNGVPVIGVENEPRPILNAVEYNRPQIVEYLLKTGAKTDVKNTEGLTPLHLAVSRGYERIVTLLLCNNAIVHVKNNRLKSCIYTAVECKMINMEIISLLLEHGADVNDKYSNASLLHIAVSRTYIPLVELLLENGANVNDCRYDGFTALHIAVEKRSLPLVNMLLSRKASVNSRSVKGCGPLHLAIKGGNFKIVKLLLDSGANVNSNNNSGETVLGAAIKKGRHDIVKLILSHNPDKNDIYNSDVVCRTVLGSSSDTSKIVRDLVQYGFKADYHKFKNDAVKIFSEALQCNFVEVVDQFLKTGYDVNKLSQNKYFSNFHVTPLHHAIESQCDLRVVKVLLEHGADVSSNCKLGTPVMMAVQKSKPQLLSLLLKYRRSTQNDPSLLISAAYIGNTEIIEILLRNGSEVNGKPAPKQRPNAATVRCRRHRYLDCQVPECIPTRDPHEIDAGTALHMAVTRGNEDALNMLLEYGANPNSETKTGLTPLRLAAEKKLWGIFKTLLIFGANLDLDHRFHKSPLSSVYLAAYPQVFWFALACNFTKSSTPVKEEGLRHILTNVGIMKSYVKPPPGMEECWEFLLRHVARLKAANLLAEHIVVPQKFQDELEKRELVKQCESEIERLKSTTLPVTDDNLPARLHAKRKYQATVAYKQEDFEFDASVYDALTGSARRVARLRRNGAVLRFVNSQEFEQRFPIYGSYVKIRLEKRDVRREYVDRIQETCRLTPNCLSKLPFEVIEVILGYLSNQELKILMDVYTPIRRFC